MQMLLLASSIDKTELAMYAYGLHMHIYDKLNNVRESNKYLAALVAAETMSFAFRERQMVDGEEVIPFDTCRSIWYGIEFD